jgi:hypothetical protein
MPGGADPWQLVPQAPQFVTEALVLVSHPFPACPSQLPHPESHMCTHALLAQLGDAFAQSSAHTVVQLPQ